MERMESDVFGYGLAECKKLSNIQYRGPTGNYRYESERQWRYLC